MLYIKKTLDNGQKVHKISLALADFLVGFIAFPFFVGNTINHYICLPIAEDLTRLQDSLNLPPGNESQSLRSSGLLPSARCSAFFSKPFMNTVGFFTTMSVYVSICSLVAAGIDRFVAIRYPLKYTDPSSILMARKVAVAIWILAAVVCSIPFFINNDEAYDTMFFSVIAPRGYHGIVICFVMFIFLFLLMWFVTISTIVVYMIRDKKQEHLHTSRKSKNEAALLFHNLIVVLGLMVGVFSLSVLPALAFLAFLVSDSRIYSGYDNSDVRLLTDNEFTLLTSVDGIVTIVLLANSLWNFFIYSARDTAFRKASKKFYKHLLCCCQ